MAQGQPAMTEAMCEACAGSWPKQDHLIADLGLTTAYLYEDQFFPGWTVGVFKRHATELFQLAPTERFQLMEEVTLVAKTLAHIFEAKKINDELLGNQLPHIHWHLIPHLATDPAPMEPVRRVEHTPVPLALPALQERIRHIATGWNTDSSKPFPRPAGGIMLLNHYTEAGGSQVFYDTAIGSGDPLPHHLHHLPVYLSLNRADA